MRVPRFLRDLTFLILLFFLLFLPADRPASALERVPEAVESATPERSAPERAALLRECRACRVRLRDGTEARGALLDVWGDTLGIRTFEPIHRSPFVSGVAVRTAVPFDQIAAITCGEDDPAWDGPLFGFLAGGLPVGFMVALVTSGLKEPGYDEYENASTLKAFGLGLAVGGGIGALFGYIFDSAFEHHERRVDPAALREAWARNP